jgi:hypothetical protein
MSPIVNTTGTDLANKPPTVRPALVSISVAADCV